MQAPGGPEEDPTGGFRFGGWTAPFWSEDMGPFEKIIESDYDLLLGKRTYDIFAAYWPNNRDNAIGEQFQRIDKYVLTHSDQPLEWDNSYQLSGETAGGGRGSQEKRGPRSAHPGQQHALSAADFGWVDRPAGPDDLPGGARAGQAIFDGSRKAGGLKLVDSFVSATGVVTAIYEPAGEVQTGTFATKEPSEDELKLRGENQGRRLVTLTLYAHPFSSYCWKVQIPLDADGTS